MSNISGFVQSPEKNGAVDVYADGEYVMTLSEDTVIESGLKIGMVLDEKALETVERARQLIKARAKAYNYLSYGDMSVKTMLTKLARAGISDDVALDTVDLLCEQGYLDDMRYACALASYLANTKCYGPRRIAQELFVKGVGEYTDDALASLDTDFYQTVRVHIPKNIDFTDRRACARLYGQLARRGFDSDVINSVIKEADFFDE